MGESYIIGILWLSAIITYFPLDVIINDVSTVVLLVYDDQHVNVYSAMSPHDFDVKSGFPQNRLLYFLFFVFIFTRKDRFL